MKRLQKALIAGLTTASLLVLVGFSTLAVADQNKNHFTAHLNGFQETPTMFSTGSGEFTATLSADGTTLSYTLTYTGLISVFVAHIHLGEPAVAGGVSAFLCGGGGKPACPVSSGTVSGTITAADIVGPASQGLAAGQFANFLTGLRAGATYVNVHTAAHAGGEIRGQILPGESD
jgi:CHRD domain